MNNQKKHNWQRIMLFIILFVLGVFIIYFGEIDDSPGAQLIGFLLIAFNFWRFIKGFKETNN